MRVNVRLLGPFELWVDSRRVAVPSERVRALLAGLAVDAGRVVGVDALAGRVWGEKLPDRPRPSLQTLVNRLRGLLGADAVRTGDDGYLLGLPPDAVDSAHLLRLLDTAAVLPDERAYPVLREALALWRGEPLLGCGSESLRQDAGPPLTERYLSALQRRVDLDLAAGVSPGLIGELRDLVGRHPLREPLWARLLVALHRAGRQAEALQAYQDVRQRVAEAFGVHPSAEVQRAHLDILADDGSVPSVPESTVDTGRVVPRQLPPGLPSLAGRAAALAELDGATAGVLAVHGPGGVGKTTLALHWAHRHAAAFPDGQVYLDLRGYGPGEPVPPAEALDVVLRTVGVPPRQIPAAQDERSALLRTRLAGGRTLLVLDNARDAAQVRPLLPGGANVALVTSRNDLGGLAVRDGAARVNLRELPAEESVRLLADALGPQRTTAEPDAAAELAGLCGGLPLALVIAAQRAARYPGAPLADAVTELRADRLDVLGDPGDPAADPRAVFSWSYHALADDAARAFRRLGLHPAPTIGLPAAVALLGVSRRDARGLLDVLVSVHLLERDGREGYRFHDLLREYAAELAAEREPAAEVAAALRRVLDWYLHSTNAARTATFAEMALGPLPETEVEPLAFTDHRTATAWFDAQRPTLLAVLTYATEHGYARHGWQLALLMRNFFAIRFRRDDQLRVAGQAVECAARDDDAARACAYHAYGAALEESGDRRDNGRWHLRALELGERLGLHTVVANTLVSLGLSQLAQLVDGAPDLAGALDYLHRGLAAAERSGLDAQRGHVLLNLGAVEGMGGLLDESIEHTAQALRLYRGLGSTYYQAFALGNLAEAHYDRGDHADALRHADEALALLGDVDDRLAASGTLVVKGKVHLATGDRDAARTAWQHALRILRAAEDPLAEDVAGLLAGLEEPESAQRSS